MSAFVGCRHDSGPPEPDDGWPAHEIEPCCYGYVDDGWRGCDCWVPVFSAERQTPPDAEVVQLLGAGIEPNSRDQMCPDCAYRPESPEKLGDQRYRGDADFLEEIARNGERFWCHQGMLIVKAWRHPSGVEIPGAPGAYVPPIVGGVPYQTDGRPGEVCAGWNARRRALAARTAVQP